MCYRLVLACCLLLAPFSPVTAGVISVYWQNSIEGNPGGGVYSIEEQPGFRAFGQPGVLTKVVLAGSLQVYASMHAFNPTEDVLFAAAEASAGIRLEGWNDLAGALAGGTVVVDPYSSDGMYREDEVRYSYTLADPSSLALFDALVVQFEWSASSADYVDPGLLYSSYWGASHVSLIEYHYAPEPGLFGLSLAGLVLLGLLSSTSRHYRRTSPGAPATASPSAPKSTRPFPGPPTTRCPR